MSRMGWLSLLMATGLVVSSSYGALEGRFQLVLDPDDTEESQIGYLAGVGYHPAERFTLGVYGSIQPTDRELPNDMDMMYGLGGYAEFDLTEGYALMPYVGLRAGLIETSGPGYDTAFEAVGLAGLRYGVTEALALSFSVNFHWASEDFYDYKAKGDIDYSVDDTDVTFDVGLRYLFW